MSDYVESWCKQHGVTQEERQSFQLSHMLSAMAACERTQDIKIVSWRQKADIELARLRREARKP